MWLKDALESEDTRVLLQDLLPGVREPERYLCRRCASECYVLPGLSLDLTREDHALIYVRYMAQKPLHCPACNAYMCQKCAREALLALDVTPLARGRIAEQLADGRAKARADDDKVVTRAFCPDCGEQVDYA